MPLALGPNKRRDWTRTELLRALSLYCQVPFGQFHSKNPHVIALAQEIGRTPSSVSMKLTNFASLDPFHKARGVSGMSNSSRADRAIWEEFYGRWDALAQASTLSLVQTAQNDAAAPVKLSLTETTRSVSVRIGQAFFRNAVLAAWDGRCAVTDISEPALLRASHIWPWASHPDTRLDPSNGLCLNALHDAAFDRGLITFSERLELKLSNRLRKAIPKPVYITMFENLEGRPLRVPDRFRPAMEAMEWHRLSVFSG